MTSVTGKKKNRIPGGFTLVELACVALIMSLVAGLSIPLLKRTAGDIEIRNAAFAVAQAINYAQEAAVTEKTVYRLSFDRDKYIFRLARLVNGAAAPETGHKRALVIPPNIEITSDPPDIFFYPDGRHDDIRIQLLGRDKTGYLLNTKSISGGVSVDKIEV